MANKEKSGLTAKQERFCREYIIDYNGQKAGERAGYSKATARIVCCDLLSKPKIRKRVKELQEEVADRLNISVDRVLCEYAKLAFTDLPGIVHWEKGLMKIEDFQNLSPDQKACIKKFKVKTVNKILDGESIPVDVVEIELHDKRGALDMIGKHLGMFVEKHDLNVFTPPDLIINFNSEKKKEDAN